MQEIIALKRRNVKNVGLVSWLLYLGVDEGLHSEQHGGFLLHQPQVRHDVRVSDSSQRTRQIVHRCMVAIDLIKHSAHSYVTHTHKNKLYCSNIVSFSLYCLYNSMLSRYERRQKQI